MDGRIPRKIPGEIYMSKEIMNQLNVGDILLWTWSDENCYDAALSQVLGIKLVDTGRKVMEMSLLSAEDDGTTASSFKLFEYHFIDIKYFKCIQRIPYGSELFTDIIYTVNDQPGLNLCAIARHFPELLI